MEKKGHEDILGDIFLSEHKIEHFFKDGRIRTWRHFRGILFGAPFSLLSNTFFKERKKGHTLFLGKFSKIEFFFRIEEKMTRGYF